MKQTLSVALATHNEEANIGPCLESVKGLADEIVVVDGSSTDKTAEIAKSFGAKVLVKENLQMFHINKQKAIDTCTGDWILQLDADERVSPQLGAEIKRCIELSDAEMEDYQNHLPKLKLFRRHQHLIEERDASGEKKTGVCGPFSCHGLIISWDDTCARAEFIPTE